MKHARAYHLLLVFLISSMMAGCAFVDQKVDLSYEKTVGAKGGAGDLTIAKPTEMQTLTKKGDNLWVIGTVKNTYGMRTADTVTDNNLGDWVVRALTHELTEAGYVISHVDKLPNNVQKGLDVTIIRVWVDQDAGFWTVGAISDVQFNVDIWRNGEKLKTLNLAGKADDRSMVGGTAETKGLSLKKALQAAMQQAVPEIIKTLE